MSNTTHLAAVREAAERILYAIPAIEGPMANPICSSAEKILRILDEAEKDKGNWSDGYHTFNELYHHRAVLFSVICNANPDIAWKSKLHHDGTMYDEMFIVGINTPEGQATYHYDIEPYWPLFAVKELEKAPEWDGHTPDQAIWRIGTLGFPGCGRRIKRREGAE